MYSINNPSSTQARKSEGAKWKKIDEGKNINQPWSTTNGLPKLQCMISTNVLTDPARFFDSSRYRVVLHQGNVTGATSNAYWQLWAVAANKTLPANSPFIPDGHDKSKDFGRLEILVFVKANDMTFGFIDGYEIWEMVE
ncbi:hypothetical protein DBT82_RS20765 [Vibrio parahaemolyticus]|nr:hypothetical protein [Vibrio parahaemolyticus]EJG0350552.1 hypothetical protein [Vibrio parahaemolyticus]EJG0554096.1 hypothetical protein [Vibrio parahaemolyticus]MCC3821594.1 hypothetical protein [Vibrio parahaemolyticus]HAS6490058.1 hypothetical protein [Vibrio parahaemolyticus]